MADATLKESFQTIRTRLVQMGKDAIPEAMFSRDYADVPGYGGSYPACELFPRRVGQNRKVLGAGMTRMTVDLEQWIWCEEVAAGYEGQIQEKAYWEYIPECLQYFEEHRTLQYAGASEGIPFYEDTLSGVVNIEVTVQSGEDGVNALVLIFTWSIALDTAFPLKCG
jgi:hypothetical protein